MPTFPKIGDKTSGTVTAFELVLEEHIEFIDPDQFGLAIEGVNPRDYFITSGDAVEKVKYLEKILWRHASDIRKRCLREIGDALEVSPPDAYEFYLNSNEPEALREYEAGVWRAAGAARRLRNALVKARGTHCFLETEWDDSRLLCKPKNPKGWPK